jgi:hypothetical protein
MSTNQHDVTLAERDQAIREAIAAAEQAVLRVVEEEQPTSLSELRAALERTDLNIDRSLIRTAILRLLNAHRLRFAAGDAIATL